MKKKIILIVLVGLMSIFLISGSVVGVELGDLNDDGSVNSSDYTLLRRYLLKMTSDINIEAARLSDDNEVNSNDYILLRRYILDLIDSFPGNGNGGSGSSNEGFYVENGRVYDANGSEFIMRGVNHAHTWFKHELDTALSGIANTNSNIVRIVLSNGGQWTKDDKNSLEEIIQKCKQHNMVIMFEIHDCTGYGEPAHAPDAVALSTAVDYWIEMKDALVGQEEYVIINIANEPFGNNVSADQYVNEHIEAIIRLRDAGFKHALVVDGANWGQDWEEIMLNRALDIFEADPDKNIIFSIHMYEVYQSDYDVNNYMQTFVDNNLPLIVGEFGADHYGTPVAVEAILQRAEEYGLGYIGWSWKGNNQEVASLDIANDWAGNSLSSWGDLLVNGVNGIKDTSQTCTIFTQ